MEALAAVGLASNVLQFVQFASELFSISSAIRKNTEAQPIEYNDLEVISRSLKEHTQALNARCNADMQALVNSAREIATQLLDTIDKLKKKCIGNPNRYSKWTCFRQALQVILKKSAIEDLTSRLERIRGQLQFHLIVQSR